jgi:signal transduction histidine kinase/ActR/RegA family two-component response regulator
VQDIWNAIFEVADSLFMTALVTQCVLAWVFATLFLFLLRSASWSGFFRSWTWAWYARAIALTAVCVRFLIPVANHAKPSAFDGTLFSIVCYSIYQTAKFANAWWLLEGALVYAGRSGRPLGGRGVLFLLALFGVVSVLVAGSIEDALAVQAPLVILSGGYAAWALLRLPSERASFGSRLAGITLLVQSGLWCLYLVAFAQPFRGTWPIVRTPWTVLTAHNSYFDLAVDVLVASGLLAILLQELYNRQRETEVEQLRLREELGRAERLRSLGTLVSGVAHELNNPLAAILGFSETLPGASEEKERLRAAEVIREQALRCRRIVRGLATFSGQETEVRERIELEKLLERVVQGFRFELERSRVSVQIDAPDALPRLNGDRYALEQLFTNLLANALQVSPADSSVRITLRMEHEHLAVTLRDEGPGIPPETLPRLFDPFFTTKPPGQGMGMGLAVAHGIARSHGGTIRAENAFPRGAAFVVELPLRSREQQEELAPKEIPRPLARAGDAPALCLLAIEDEPMLCEMLRSIGRQQGWKVVTASTGREGLELVLEANAPFDVVLCDLRMASPSGIEIHDQLVQVRPELLRRFLFVTGDLSSEDAAEFAERCQRPILRKPFQIADLVREVEDTAATAATR